MGSLKTPKPRNSPFLFLLILSSFLLLMSACEGKWDLTEVDFLEVTTLKDPEMGEQLTEMIVFGEIKGLKDKARTVEEHGHIWIRPDSASILDLDHYHGRVQKQRATNGVYSSLLEELTPGKLYSFRAYAVSMGKTYYGEIHSFTAGSLGPQIAVTTVEVLTKSSAGSEISVIWEIAELPQGLQINDHGLVLVQLTSPDDPSTPSLEPGNGDVYSLGPIPNANSIHTFSTPISQLSPGYFKLRGYFKVYEAIFYSDVAAFAIGNFWERREDIPSLVSSFTYTTLEEKAYFNFNTSYQNELLYPCFNIGFYSPSFWSYDVQEKWTKMPLPFPNATPTVGGTAFSIEDTIYFGMGYDVLSSGSNLNWEIYKFIPNTANNDNLSLFCISQPLSCPVRAYGVSFNLGGKVYFGLGLGYDSNGSSASFPLNDLWEFDPGAETPLTRVADFPGGHLFGAVAFTLGDKAYIGLGEKSDGSKNTDFWAFDGSQWSSEVASFPGQGRVSASTFTIHGKAYVGWGLTARYTDICEVGYSGAFGDLWQFDPDVGPTGKWTIKEDFPGIPRGNVAAFSLGGSCFAGLGKYTPYDIPFTDLYQYYPD